MPSWRASLVGCSCLCTLAAFCLMLTATLRSDWSDQRNSGSAGTSLSLGLRHYREYGTGKEGLKKFKYAEECEKIFKCDATHCEQLKNGNQATFALSVASALLHLFALNFLLSIWMFIRNRIQQPRYLSRLALYTHCLATLCSVVAFIVYRMMVINDALQNTFHHSVCFRLAVVAALLSGVSLFVLFGYLYEVEKDEEDSRSEARWNLRGDDRSLSTRVNTSMATPSAEASKETSAELSSQ